MQGIQIWVRHSSVFSTYKVQNVGFEPGLGSSCLLSAMSCWMVDHTFKFTYADDTFLESVFLRSVTAASNTVSWYTLTDLKHYYSLIRYPQAKYDRPTMITTLHLLVYLRSIFRDNIIRLSFFCCNALNSSKFSL